MTLLDLRVLGWSLVGALVACFGERFHMQTAQGIRLRAKDASVSAGYSTRVGEKARPRPCQGRESALHTKTYKYTTCTHGSRMHPRGHGRAGGRA